MTRRRGWGGSPPGNDDEARDRIVGAAVELIEARGASVSIADVAESLGVIRQTVYRYFPSADALVRAAAMASVAGFLGRLAAHLRGITDPARAVIEGIVFTLDQVPRIPHLGIMLAGTHSHTEAIASAEAMEFGITMIHRFDVDWAAHGYDDAELRGLVELQLRIMQSFFISPAARTEAQLRAYLQRWIAPAITSRGGRNGSKT